MQLKDNIKTFSAATRKQWRSWLKKNHILEKSVWLIIYRKESSTRSIYYPEAVEEALCFGWIDSKGVKRDHESYYQFFSKRNPKSKWSKLNKERVDRLIDSGSMEPAGLEIIQTAKENGSWNALDDIDSITIPADLQQGFDKNKNAFDNWNRFSDSSKRMILQWIKNAKLPATRTKRVETTIAMAAENRKANHPS